MIVAAAASISIVVVAADSGPLLLTCVRSVLSPAVEQGAPIELILVDNASSDGFVDQVLAEYADEPRLRVLRNANNLGFGPACNLGAATASGDTLVFLNPDCDAPPGLPSALRRALLAHPEIGLLGVSVRDADGQPARGNRRRDPSLRRSVMSLTGLARLEARHPRFAGVEMPPSARDSGIEQVEAVSGACMALPRAVFEQLGGFDEGYFLHAEDLDLCRRVRIAGLRVAIDHSLQLLHVQGSSSRHRPVFVSLHKHRGMWRYFGKFDSAARNPLLRACVWLALWARFALGAAIAWLKRRPR